ncbi:MAG: hypothetical protein ACRDG7_19595 [Candidatus Limnocylindria bacterium]
MSQDGGRRKSSIRKTLGDSGGQPPEYAPSGDGGPHNRGHMKYPDAPIHFDVLNIATGETVRIVEKGKDGIWLDAESNEYKPHRHRLGVVPVV